MKNNLPNIGQTGIMANYKKTDEIASRDFPLGKWKNP